jgi:hypothetical protein
MIQAHEAMVNVTYNGQNFELPDPVNYTAGDEDVKGWISEAIRTGSIRGVAADPNVDLINFVVDRFDAPADPAPGQRAHNLIQIRPKTAYGAQDDLYDRTLADGDVFGWKKRFRADLIAMEDAIVVEALNTAAKEDELDTPS